MPSLVWQLRRCALAPRRWHSMLRNTHQGYHAIYGKVWSFANQLCYCRLLLGRARLGTRNSRDPTARRFLRSCNPEPNHARSAGPCHGASKSPRIIANPKRITPARVCEDQLSQSSMPLVLDGWDHKNRKGGRRGETEDQRNGKSLENRVGHDECGADHRRSGDQEDWLEADCAASRSADAGTPPRHAGGE